jgi:hypothetical protein
VSRLEQPHGDDWASREAQRREARSAQAPAADIPTFSECVIGYRAWAIDPFLRLWSLTGYASEPWTPGTNIARCGRGNIEPGVYYTTSHAPDGHNSPHSDCGCGLYCRRRSGEVLDELEWPRYEEIRNPMVAGAVAVWGDLRVHRDGFRASHACVIALATQPTMPFQMRDLAALVADRYGVPLVAADEIEIEARRHGTPLPDEVAPPPGPTYEDLFGAWAAAPAPAPAGAYTTFSLTTARPTSGTPMPQRPSRQAVAATVLVVVVLAWLWSRAVFGLLGAEWWSVVLSVAGGMALGHIGAKVLLSRGRNRTAAS